MSKYKLVPFPPTPEMVSAAEEAYMPFGDMQLALMMAMLNAPTPPNEDKSDTAILNWIEQYGYGVRSRENALRNVLIWGNGRSLRDQVRAEMEAHRARKGEQG